MSRLRYRHRTRGLTLIEVLIVVEIIALMSAEVLFGTGMFGSTRTRAAATLIASAVRMGIMRANTTGRPVRMVMDLDKQRLMLEETTGVMLREKEKKSATGGAEAATAAE